MITDQKIRANLNDLDSLYNKPTNTPQEATYYCKLALLELCGWIEESMDCLIRKHSKRLKNQVNKDYVNNVIDKNHGFNYEGNFREMLIKIIGIIQVERLEFKLEKQGDITQLKSILKRLNKPRNEAAHTFYKGVTQIFQAPSTSLGDLSDIYQILKKIETELQQLK
jgi:hypothetical protein